MPNNDAYYQAAVWVVENGKLVEKCGMQSRQLQTALSYALKASNIRWSNSDGGYVTVTDLITGQVKSNMPIVKAQAKAA